MIRCLLVDDEPLALDALENLTGKIPELKIIGRCPDAVDALRFIHENEIDLVFLDIQMPELTGIEMLRSLDNPPKVIFTTAYREHAVEAFELDVIDYLVKPISLERLLKAVNRYHDRIKTSVSNREERAESITFYSDKKTHRLAIDDILWVEGLKDYALVHTVGSRLVIRQTMKKLEELLSGYGFRRVHRSWIIPLKHVKSWTNHSLFIKDREFPVGKTYRKSIFETLESRPR